MKSLQEALKDKVFNEYRKGFYLVINNDKINDRNKAKLDLYKTIIDSQFLSGKYKCASNDVCSALLSEKNTLDALAHVLLEEKMNKQK